MAVSSACLNPLYCGVYLLTSMRICALRSRLCLNPLYCGVYLLTGQVVSSRLHSDRLNPLYCGVYLLTLCTPSLELPYEGLNPLYCGVYLLTLRSFFNVLNQVLTTTKTVIDFGALKWLFLNRRLKNIYSITALF